MQEPLVTALKKVYDSKEYKEFMASRGFGVILGRSRRHHEVHG